MRSITVFGIFSFLCIAPAQAELSRASFYGKEFAGRKTASGERFNPSGFTAAHRSLPFGTKLKLTNTANGRQVVVRVTDRGPFVRGRSLDVSLGAAQALGFVARGTANLRMERVNGLAPETAPAPASVPQLAETHGEAAPIAPMDMILQPVN